MASLEFRVARRPLLFSIVIGTVLLCNGCSVALNHGDLVGATRTYSEPIDVSSRAEGIDGKVGWGRATLFYIPCVPVYIQGDGNEKIMQQVRDALQETGYKVNVVETTVPTHSRLLKAEIDTFWFNNYTWFFPFVPTWGDIDVTLSLQRPDSQIAWHERFHGHGFTINFFDGYSTAANEAMGNILNQMVQAFASEKFHDALVQGTANARAPVIESATPHASSFDEQMAHAFKNFDRE